MYNFVFIRGAQGSGKTTIARLLKEKLGSTCIDFDWIRDFHLNKNWTNADNAEEEMALENLVFLLKNYEKHGYKNVIIGGFPEKVLNQIKEYKYLIITLYLHDDEMLKKRVLTESRDSGFRDFERSIRWNKLFLDEPLFPNEKKIDTTNQTPEETANKIVEILNLRSQEYVK